METTGLVWILYHSATQKQSRPLSLSQAQVEILRIKNKELPDYLIWTPGWGHWQRLGVFLKSKQPYFVFSQPSPSVQFTAPPIPELATQPQEGQSDAEETNHNPTQTLTQTGTENTSSESFEFNEESPFTQVQLEAFTNTSTDYGYYHNDFNGENLSLSDIQKAEKKIKSRSSKNLNRRNYQRLDLKLEVFLVSRSHTFKTYSQNISLGGTLLYDDVPKSFLNSSFDLLIVNNLDPNPTTGRLLFKAKIVGELLNAKRLRFIKVDKTMTEKLKALLNAYVTYQKMTNTSKAG